MQYNSNNRWPENFQILIDKIGFLMLFKTFFRTILAFLEAEIFRFFMLQLAWNTLYCFMTHLPRFCLFLTDSKHTISTLFPLFKSFNFSASAPFYLNLLRR